MSADGSPPAMKCTDRALGGRSWTRVRVAATNAWAIIWPPKVRTGFLCGCAPAKTSSPIGESSRIAISSSKSDVLSAAGTRGFSL